MDTYQYKYGDRPLEGYTIERAAGRGGFGEVYYAVSDSGRQVALKAIQSYEQIELRGISQCMNLKSPHLVSIFDVRHNDQGKPFVIMEYVSGPSLSDLLKESPGGLGTQKAAFFLREIGKGLSFLHDCGIVHRDLKPGNIFYENGYVKIGDYGLSKAINAGHGGIHNTIVGTIHYMAPEIGTGQYDHRVDIYALGVVLHEMLSGEPPFSASDPREVLLKHQILTLSLEGIEEPFARVIRRAMAKEPDERYDAVQAMVEDVFGAEHVRNSVSQFSPEQLTIVAQRIAKEMCDRQFPDDANHADAGQHQDGQDLDKRIVQSVSPDAAKLIRSTSNDGYLESMLASYAITETQAVQILNEWSLRRPKCLSPLCEYARLDRVENRWAVRVEMEILVEERSLEHETVPYLSDVHQRIEPFKEDIWSIPFRPPDSFVKKEYSHRAFAPDQVLICKECNGSGKWVCSDCHGKTEVMCPQCEGTGKYKVYAHCYEENRKCEYCHGATKIPCTTCKGEGPLPCGNCGTTGKVALYPIIKSKFWVEGATRHLSESAIEWDISDWSGILLDHSMAQGTEIPVIPEFIPATIRRRIEAMVGKVRQDIAGQVQRTGMSFFLVPFTESHLRYAGRPFTMIITGIKKVVLTTGWIPLNRRRATCFYIGIPLVALFSGEVIVSAILTDTGTLVRLGFLGLLGSLGYLLWALFSKPKGKRGDISNAI